MRDCKGTRCVCASPTTRWAGIRRRTKSSSSPSCTSTMGGFQILLASYGETDDRVDVTRRLNDLAHNGQLQIQVSNATMGRDPSLGHVKRLTVIYLWQGLRYQMSAAEGETLSIP